MRMLYPQYYFTMSHDEVFLMYIVTVICIITPSVMKFIRNSRKQDNIEYIVRPITSKYKAEVKPCMPKNGTQNVLLSIEKRVTF